MIRIFTFVLAFLTAGSLMAQDQISVGQGYSLTTFYDIESGQTTSVDYDAYDIAFQMSNFSSIHINEAVPSTQPPVTGIELYYTEVIDFAEADTSDIVEQVYNDESSWSNGAFSKAADEDDPFDVGWGVYNPANHVITGTRVFFIRLFSGQYIKFKMSSLKSGILTFKYANPDGTNEQEISIDKSEYEGDNMIYFSFSESTTVDVEPEKWDLVFMRYITPLPDGQGNILDYNVTGILTNSGVETAQADNINPETVSYENYKDSLKAENDIIGHDWKYFSLGDFSWYVEENRAYFVKSNNGDIYKLQFVDFEGSSTGTGTVLKTFVTTSSLVESIKSAGIEVYPNPATELLNIDLSQYNGNEISSISLINMKGQEVSRNSGIENSSTEMKSIPVHNLPKGIYTVLIQGSKKVISTKVLIK